MADVKKVRKTAQAKAKAESTETLAKLAKAKAESAETLAKLAKKDKEIAELRAVLERKSLQVEAALLEAVPSSVTQRHNLLKEQSAQFKAGLYVASAVPMYNGDTQQMFSVSAPIAVTDDQLKTSWFLSQLSARTIKPYKG